MYTLARNIQFLNLNGAKFHSVYVCFFLNFLHGIVFSLGIVSASLSGWNICQYVSDRR